MHVKETWMAIIPKKIMEKNYCDPLCVIPRLSNQEMGRAISPRSGSFSGFDGTLPRPRGYGRCLKERKGEFKMVVGKGIKIFEIVNLSRRTLVGRFCRKEVRIEALCHWMDTKRCPLLGYSPEVHTLV
jgi:hypothetical protein